MAIKQVIKRDGLPFEVTNPKPNNELLEAITRLANLENLDSKCHIRPDWLLIYKYVDDKIVLVLFSTGSHSELFKN